MNSFKIIVFVAGFFSLGVSLSASYSSPQSLKVGDRIVLPSIPNALKGLPLYCIATILKINGDGSFDCEEICISYVDQPKNSISYKTKLTLAQGTVLVRDSVDPSLFHFFKDPKKCRKG